LTHMARSALGEIFSPEKKSSRRRRSTFGNEDADAESTAECPSAASDGTRSSISGFRLISASSRTLPAMLSGRRPQPDLARIDQPALDFVPQIQPSGASLKLRMNASSKT
jgi:hypothetical protein